MNSIVPLHPVRHQPGKNRQTTSSSATPEERVRGLLRFPFSAIVREHTIKVLLSDPETQALTIAFLTSHNAR